MQERSENHHEGNPRLQCDILAKKWLMSTCRNLADRPEEIAIDLVVGRQRVIFEVDSAKEDVRRLIGKKGATVIAIRHILACLGGKSGRRYDVALLEE